MQYFIKHHDKTKNIHQIESHPLHYHTGAPTKSTLSTPPPLHTPLTRQRKPWLYTGRASAASSSHHLWQISYLCRCRPLLCWLPTLDCCSRPPRTLQRQCWPVASTSSWWHVARTSSSWHVARTSSSWHVARTSSSWHVAITSSSWHVAITSSSWLCIWQASTAQNFVSAFTHDPF